MLPKLYGERINQIINFLVEIGEKPLVSKQLLRAVYKSNTNSFSSMGELPKNVRGKLIEKFGETVSSVAPVISREADFANKVLFECHDKNRIEAVSLSFHNHYSLCISSQLGCAFGCTFCETGKVGLKRQLTVSEITDQVLHFKQSGDVGSISFMGMGEPLSNPKVFDAISGLINPSQFGVSPSRINVSTIGIIPGLRKLNQVHPKVNVAFSLHSPFPDQRLQLMPIEKAYPFMETMKVLDERIKMTRNRVWLAYLLLEGVNDSLDHARALVDLIHQRPPEIRYLYHVNLLPYNPGRTQAHNLKRLDDISSFQRIVQKAGIQNSYRNSFGRSIDAACGQLYADYEAKNLAQL
jgi:23S rRNA (adenine-C8)-methyltransferase